MDQLRTSLKYKPQLKDYHKIKKNNNTGIFHHDMELMNK